ncbi:MAG: tRNA-intron lyase [Candidatus Aenigmatarchaeota archaeon]|nr:tRNA-intron lyase [Candidatus Aenigmarchaeota archaeon]
MVIEATLSEDRVIIWDREAGNKIFETGYYGKPKEDRLELSLIEAMHLLNMGKIKVVDVERKEIDAKAFMKYCHKIDPRFDFRYAVYSDLRNRQLPTRTGFKFGCDFRVYAKGVKPLKRGPKSAKEHTKWIVYAVPEKFVCSFQELSRAVRLAHNIRANMLWAIVDEEGNVSYYQVTFFKP